MLSAWPSSAQLPCILPISQQSTAMAPDLLRAATAGSSTQNLLYCPAEIEAGPVLWPNRTGLLRELLRRSKIVCLFVFNEILRRTCIVTDEMLLKTEIALESV